MGVPQARISCVFRSSRRVSLRNCGVVSRTPRVSASAYSTDRRGWCGALKACSANWARCRRKVHGLALAWASSNAVAWHSLCLHLQQFAMTRRPARCGARLDCRALRLGPTEASAPPHFQARHLASRAPVVWALMMVLLVCLQKELQATRVHSQPSFSDSLLPRRSGRPTADVPMQSGRPTADVPMQSGKKTAGVSPSLLRGCGGASLVRAASL